jgi:hypothetical protein
MSKTLRIQAVRTPVDEEEEEEEEEKQKEDKIDLSHDYPFASLALFPVFFDFRTMACWSDKEEWGKIYDVTVTKDIMFHGVVRVKKNSRFSHMTFCVEGGCPYVMAYLDDSLKKFQLVWTLTFCIDPQNQSYIPTTFNVYNQALYRSSSL